MDFILRTAKNHDANTLYRLRTVPRIGKILSFVILCERAYLWTRLRKTSIDDPTNGDRIACHSGARAGAADTSGCRFK